MARPTNESLKDKNFFREECQTIELLLNDLEKINKTSAITQKEDYSGQIGLLTGKIMTHFMFLERELDRQYNIFDGE